MNAWLKLLPLAERNPFPREALVARDFDPVQSLLISFWGVVVLRDKVGERVMRSLDSDYWQQIVAEAAPDGLPAAGQLLAYDEQIQRMTEAELQEIYLRIQEDHPEVLDHLAAVRAILVPECTWLWGAGVRHDVMLAHSGHKRLLGRFRNQRLFYPRLEFEPEAPLQPALQLLLEQGFEPDDRVDIEAPGLRAASIGEALRYAT